MISYWGHMISYVYDIMYMISYENTYDIIRHDIRYHMYMISYLMYTISYLWYHVYGAMRSWISMYDIICIIEPNASKAKWTLQNIPLETQVESRYVHLNNFITWIFDVLQPIQRRNSGDPGTAESIAALTNLTFNKHIIYYMMYDTISCNIINMSNQNNVLHTSGAMRSRSRKGKVRSKILTRTLSPIMCLPVCLSTYMSMKCVAYAEVTSTMVKEESNELDRSLRRVQMPLILASDTTGLSGPR